MMNKVKEKLITVVIPTKNRSTMLKEALNCFSHFTSEISLIVVDDGSDQVHKELNEKNALSIAKYFYNSKSTGGGGARNVGAAVATTEYLWFFDDDDIVEKQTINDLIIAIKKQRKDVYLLPMRVVNGTKTERIIYPTENKNNYEVYRDSIHQVNTSCTIIRKESFVKAGKWDENFVSGQDTDLFLRLSVFSNYFCINTKPVIIQTNHNDRITTNITKRKKGALQFVRKNWKLMSLKNILRYFKIFFHFSYIDFKTTEK